MSTVTAEPAPLRFIIITRPTYNDLATHGKGVVQHYFSTERIVPPRQYGILFDSLGEITKDMYSVSENFPITVNDNHLPVEGPIFCAVSEALPLGGNMMRRRLYMLGWLGTANAHCISRDATRTIRVKHLYATSGEAMALSVPWLAIPESPHLLDNDLFGLGELIRSYCHHLHLGVGIDDASFRRASNAERCLIDYMTTIVLANAGRHAFERFIVQKTALLRLAMADTPETRKSISLGEETTRARYEEAIHPKVVALCAPLFRYCAPLCEEICA